MSREKTLLAFPPGSTVKVTHEWYKGGAAGWFEPNRTQYEGQTGIILNVTKGGLVHVLFPDKSDKCFPQTCVELIITATPKS